MLACIYLAAKVEEIPSPEMMLKRAEGVSFQDVVLIE